MRTRRYSRRPSRGLGSPCRYAVFPPDFFILGKISTAFSVILPARLRLAAVPIKRSTGKSRQGKGFWEDVVDRILANANRAEFGQELGIEIRCRVISSRVLTIHVVPAAFYLIER